MAGGRVRRAATWVLPALGAAVAGASLIDGGAYLAQVQAAGPALATAGLLLAAVLGVRRHLPQTALAFAASVVLVAPVLAVPPRPAPQASRTLSVLSVNTYLGHAQAEAILAEVDRRDVDVLVLPEMSDPLWIRLERLGIRKRLPFATGRSGGGAGMIVATREPTECLELTPGTECGKVGLNGWRPTETRDAGGRLTFDMTTLRLPDGTVFRAVHLWSPRLPPTSRWREQQGQMAAWIARQPADTPLILAGDFNAGPSQPAFRRYAAGLERVPRGDLPWTRTWPHTGSFDGFTQVDHVLTRHWQVMKSEALDIPGSDHRAVWALLTR